MKAVMMFFMLSMTMIYGAEVAKLKIGVVDIGKLVQEYEKSKELSDMLKGQKKEGDMVIVKISKTIEQMKQSLKIVHQSKQEQIYAQIRQKEVEKRVLKETLREELSIKHERLFFAVYKEVQGMISQYAQDNQYDLVFRKNLPPVEGLNVEQNVVLYNSKQYDITKDILKVLNVKFRQEKVANSISPKP